MLLSNKVAIVTGGAQGIGKAVAQLFCEEGANVVIVDISIDKTKETADDIAAKTGKKCIALKVDVSQKSDVEKMVSAAMGEFGKIDILVNNAGILLQKSILDMTVEEWNQIISINLTGVFICSQAVAREMIKKRYGKIIHISSCTAKKPSLREGAYAASKAGILGFNRVLAAELGPFGINCNSILPGVVVTQMVKSTFLTSSEIEAEWIEKTVLKKLGKPVDVAKTALFLASELSEHITGEAIVVSGGEMMSQ